MMRIQIEGFTYWCDFADEIRVGQFVKVPGKTRGSVWCGEVTSLKSDYSGVIKAAIEPMPNIQSFEQKLAYNTVQKMLDTVRCSMKNLAAVNRALSLEIGNVMNWKMCESYKFSVCRLLEGQAMKLRGMIEKRGPESEVL
jgi:hypothetical protein